MDVLIVGGNFGDIPKSSSIVNKFSNEFENKKVFNGGKIETLPSSINSDLALWMPNIINELPKHYPTKNIGNVLIVSKVMRDGYRRIDAISRIFKMHGNAVIAIYKNESIFRFELIDALGNIWYNGNDIKELCNKINDFYVFTKNAIRCRTIKIEKNIPKIDENVKDFIEINKSLSKYIQTSCGERFFGNISTRCSKLFPTCKYETSIFVSPRNIDKDSLTINDMIYCELKNNEIYYVGDKKPSVDSPVQLKIYNECKQISYMIHGHAFIDDVVETSEYCLCGDLKEAEHVIPLINNSNFGAINLKNHGFLIYSDTIENLNELIKTLKFSYRR